MRKYTARFLGVAFISIIAAGLVSCSSGDTGGGEDNGNGTSYDPDNAGTLTLTLNETDLQVAEDVGFIVSVKDASGAAVPDIRVSCDTEAGLALIEPNDGIQITDGGGLVSGRVGCAEIGSFRMGCRLPVGAGRRQFATITCRGPVPVGFNGFPNSGGGGLGGGSGTDEPLTDDVRIVGVAVFDEGQTSSDGAGDLGIDTQQIGDCDGEVDTDDPENFYDTIVAIDVENFEEEAINFSRISFSVSNSDGAGTPFNSAEFALINADEILGGNSDGTPRSKRFIGYLTKVGGGKVLVGNTVALPASNWVSNITYRLYGVSTSGEEVSISRRSSMAFGTYDRCS